MADPTRALLDDLADLSPDLRAAVLDALSAEERRALDALRIAVAPAEEGAGDALSPWLAAIVDRARTGDGIAPAACAALLRSVDGAGKRGVTADPAGRSLIGAMGGLLAPRRRA